MLTMPTPGEHIQRVDEKPQSKAVDSNMELGNVPNQDLDSEAGAFEAKVAEIAKANAEDSQVSSGAQDDGQTQAQKDDGALKDDRAALKSKLLANAPKEPAMRREVERVLEKKKTQLESQVKKYRRRKDYHLLSIAIMRLRLVIRQLEDLAKASYDKLKDMWLSVVHKMA